jgi:hypothetical protein
MTNVAREVENNREVTGITISSIDNKIAAFLANAAFRASTELHTSAVIIDYLTGRTGRTWPLSGVETLSMPHVIPSG